MHKLVRSLVMTACISTTAQTAGAATNESLDTLRQDVAELRQIVSQLGKQLEVFGRRIDALEKTIARKESHLLVPLDVEKGMLRDSQESNSRLKKRSFNQDPVRATRPYR